MKFCYRIFLIGLLLWMAGGCTKGAEPSGSSGEADLYQLNLVNGYGSGQYREGDTVHLFSKAYGADQVFGGWSGPKAGLLNAAAEWHTWLIMPARDLSFTAYLQAMPAFTLQFEQIGGRDRDKPVYYYFPENHKGIVFLLHGTGGSAAVLLHNFEWQQLIKDLVYDHFAVIITESEEATTQTDSNADGKLRWNNLPWDLDANVDFANILLITAEFYKRGLSDPDKPKYAIGMSNGGNFSTALATIAGFKAAISYCAPSGDQIAQMTRTPLQFCMARFDENPSVGPEGNIRAQANAEALEARGICSNYRIKERSPLYPERFARNGEISLGQSAAVFQELQSNHFIDSNNYFIGTTDALKAAYAARPDDFPRLAALPAAQQIFVLAQAGLALSGHSMYSDYNRAALRFLNQQCN
ncbi:alpha/beta hydrolase family protein [Niabella terrae]